MACFNIKEGLPFAHREFIGLMCFLVRSPSPTQRYRTNGRRRCGS